MNSVRIISKNIAKTKKIGLGLLALPNTVVSTLRNEPPAPHAPAPLTIMAFAGDNDKASE